MKINQNASGNISKRIHGNPLQWCHNGCCSVSNHRHLDCLQGRFSGAHQRKHQSCASLVFVRAIHRWPVNSPQKGPVTQNVSIWWYHHTAPVFFHVRCLIIIHRKITDPPLTPFYVDSSQISARLCMHGSKVGTGMVLKWAQRDNFQLWDTTEIIISVIYTTLCSKSFN